MQMTFNNQIIFEKKYKIGGCLYLISRLTVELQWTRQ